MKFELFNQRRQILGVLGRWKAQYPDRKADITEKLAALDLTTCSAKDVEDVIGNQSWTALWCASCSGYGDEGVGFDDGDGMTWICGNCARAAVAVLNEGRVAIDSKAKPLS